MDIIFSILQDAFFAAVAAIGFASISNPPRAAFKYCALIAAIGHATRFCLMNLAGFHIVPSSLVAALFIGVLAVFFSRYAKCPPETFSFPSLLPMIPGMYAYRTFQAMFICMTTSDEDAFIHYGYLLEYNGLTTVFVVFVMVVGQVLPMLAMKRLTFSATR